MYNDSDLIMVGVKHKQLDSIKKFFEISINNPNLIIMCEDKDKLVEDMCAAFWEDVFIELNLQKIFCFYENKTFFVNKSEHEEDLVLGNKYNLFFNTKNRDNYKMVEKKYELLKKQIKPNVWKSILPFFLYILPDLNLGQLKNFTVDTLGTYNFIYSLGLLAGKNSDYEGMAILEFIFRGTSRRFKRKNKEKDNITDDNVMEKNAQEFQYFKNLILKSDKKYLKIMDEIIDTIYLVYSSYGKKALGTDIKDSMNFECMKNLMQDMQQNVNKGYVVYCFNLLTDWFNYSLYLGKKDLNLFSYEGLALKQVACDYFCIEDTYTYIANALIGRFWEKAENKRKKIVDSLKGKWNVQKYEYKWHTQLYDAVIDNKFMLGNNRDFFEYWINRFEIEDGGEYFSKVIELFCLHDPYANKK